MGKGILLGVIAELFLSDEATSMRFFITRLTLAAHITIFLISALFAKEQPERSVMVRVMIRSSYYGTRIAFETTNGCNKILNYS